MLRKWGTIVLLLLAVPTMALAQSTGKLSGRVVDASTGEGLPGANVIIDGTQLGTATDVEGNYFIIGVPVGTYDITASFVGYTPVTQTGHRHIAPSMQRQPAQQQQTGFPRLTAVILLPETGPAAIHVLA